MRIDQLPSLHSPVATTDSQPNWFYMKRFFVASGDQVARDQRGDSPPPQEGAERLVVAPEEPAITPVRRRHPADLRAKLTDVAEGLPGYSD